ncbi:MAG: SDR family oxidoreductase [Verrucomicrobiales bacterium]
MKILVTGATGYIGGRLIPRLLEQSHEVRVLVRDSRRVAGRSWAEQVEICEGDVHDVASLHRACAEVEVAYYLVHSLNTGTNYAGLDRQAAHNFCAAAVKVPLVIYLGGLLPKGEGVSAHLRSRAEVGEILRQQLPVTEFRAGPIIGSGSASFEMVRYLTERLPIMIAPKWIRNPVQPIAVRDVLSYLLGALHKPPLGVVEIGSDVLTFRDMMLEYASVRGYKRRIIPVPVLAPWLASRWVGLVTPVSNRLAGPLVRGILHPVVSDTAKAQKLFDDIEPIPYRRAVEFALAKIEAGVVETRWSGSLGDAPASELVDWEGTVQEIRTRKVKATPEEVFDNFMSMGGDRGWLVWNWAWRVRGWIDKLVGGPGLRRGRRHPRELLPGEALDFWRVEVVEPGRMLRLRAEMKVPGKAWLQWEAVSGGDGETRLVQTAIFQPKGTGGFVYWYGIYPLHGRIFSDLIRAIAESSERSSEGKK